MNSLSLAVICTVCVGMAMSMATRYGSVYKTLGDDSKMYIRRPNIFAAVSAPRRPKIIAEVSGPAHGPGYGLQGYVNGGLPGGYVSSGISRQRYPGYMRNMFPRNVFSSTVARSGLVNVLGNQRAGFRPAYPQQMAYKPTAKRTSFVPHRRYPAMYSGYPRTRTTYRMLPTTYGQRILY